MGSTSPAELSDAAGLVEVGPHSGLRSGPELLVMFTAEAPA